MLCRSSGISLHIFLYWTPRCRSGVASRGAWSKQANHTSYPTHTSWRSAPKQISTAVPSGREMCLRLSSHGSRLMEFGVPSCKRYRHHPCLPWLGKLFRNRVQIIDMGASETFKNLERRPRLQLCESSFPERSFFIRIFLELKISISGPVRCVWLKKRLFCPESSDSHELFVKGVV